MANKHELRSPLLMLAIFLLLMIAAPARSQGGPPMLTDDPATPGPGMWEVNFLATLSRHREGWTVESPLVDLNYGVGTHIQLKLEAPWLVMKERGEKTKSGLGNTMVGVKWRFLDEERAGFDMSIYPQLDFNNPTKSVDRGLAEEGWSLFLPVEVGKKIGLLEINGELGYRILHQTDELEYGIVVAHSINNRIELMAELHGSALQTFSSGELFLNAGSRILLTKNAVLLISAGRTVRSPGGQGPQYIAAVGVQFNFKNRMPGFARNRDRPTSTQK